MNFDEKVLEKLRNSSTKDGVYIGVDIGATNCRVAVGDSSEIYQITKFECKSTRILLKNFNEIADRFKELLNSKGGVKGSCICAAGRILEKGSAAEITNYIEGKENQWLRVEELPKNLFPTSKFRFLNDLEAACYGITFLSNAKTLGEYFVQITPPTTTDTDTELTAMKWEHHLVMAIGTGLGVGLLVAFPSNPPHTFTAIPLEGGHTQLTRLGPDHPDKEEMEQLANFLSKKLYGGSHGAEFEDIVSGRGVSYVYQWLQSKYADQKLADLDTPTVVKKAVNGECKYAEKALIIHYEIAMRCAANLCIALNAKGLVLAGDNQIDNGQFFKKYYDPILRNSFLDIPKHEWISNIPVYMQTKRFNINISGCIHFAKSIA